MFHVIPILLGQNVLPWLVGVVVLAVFAIIAVVILIKYFGICSRRTCPTPISVR